MIKLKRITTSDTSLYNYVEHLLTTSFPLEEYRPLDLWRRCTDNNKLFFNNVIIEGEKPVGLITYWVLNGFYYIEHFAIDEALRNQGYGKSVLSILEKEYDNPIILEVEKPDNPTALRRISFYKRYGFTLWENEYVQPPYRPNGVAVPMCIMSRGDISSNDFDHVRRELYQKAYNISS